jgi:hypothetical protein
MELKRTKVHRLPTIVASNVLLMKDGALKFVKNEAFKHKEEIIALGGVFQHLYITTDEEIKEGDWYLDTYTANEIIGISSIFVKIGGLVVRQCSNSLPFIGKKIIASTDPKLTSIHNQPTKDLLSTEFISIPLPQPSQDFIKAYCEQGGIDEVDVECDVMDISTLTSNTDDYPNLDIVTIKVDPIHNTVITHLIEEKMIPLSKLEDCVLDVVYKMMFRANAFPQEQKDKSKEFCKEWIKENL